MPVGLNPPGELLPMQGIRLATAAAGLRYKDRDDVALMEIAAGSKTAAVFTRNAFCAAPVTVAKRHLSRAEPRWLLINSGNANAGTGEHGVNDARTSCEAVAKIVGCRGEEVLPFSTGVIGQRLLVERLVSTLPELEARLSARAWLDAARAIMTTDTVPKAVSVRAEIEGKVTIITGIAKGSGMIRPDMATMLAFIATDAAMPRGMLVKALSGSVEQSFHRITVDGDTSTNDACVLISTGQGPLRLSGKSSAGYEHFVGLLTGLMQQLAQAIVRDGEGASKFITVRIEGARDRREADLVAFAIAHSPLVKTALFASDPNWGRILAAAGRSGIGRFDTSMVDLWLGPYRVAKHGALDPDYREEQGKEAMSKDEITLKLELNRGEAETIVWTSDLSHDYVSINAAYRS